MFQFSRIPAYTQSGPGPGICSGTLLFLSLSMLTGLRQAALSSTASERSTRAVRLFLGRCPMSTARFHPRLSLYLMFTALLISASPGQGRAPISIMIDPPEATVHIGETQSFMALVNGAVNAGIRLGSSRGGRWQHNQGGRLHSSQGHRHLSRDCDGNHRRCHTSASCRKGDRGHAI